MNPVLIAAATLAFAVGTMFVLWLDAVQRVCSPKKASDAAVTFQEWLVLLSYLFGHALPRQVNLLRIRSIELAELALAALVVGLMKVLDLWEDLRFAYIVDPQTAKSPNPFPG